MCLIVLCDLVLLINTNLSYGNKDNNYYSNGLLEYKRNASSHESKTQNLTLCIRFKTLIFIAFFVCTGAICIFCIELENLTTVPIPIRLFLLVPKHHTIHLLLIVC